MKELDTKRVWLNVTWRQGCFKHIVLQIDRTLEDALKDNL